MKLLIALFIICLPIRSVDNQYAIIRDVESHLRAGHGYSDPDLITTVHECTHGINSRLRQQYGKPAFYVLENRACILDEHRGTLAQVARKVPLSLRGDVYRLYLVNAQQWWNDEPEYVFNEFVAYTNGAQARKELQIPDRSETNQYMAEFIVYSTCVPWTLGDVGEKEFLRWQIERAVKLGARRYLRFGPDTVEWQAFTRDYFGKEWAKKWLGI